jgi:quinol monooxygenase YgiN
MFTRIVEITSKAGKAREVTRTVSDRVLSILKKQPGFLDEITLVSNEDPNRIIAMSFWQSKDNADAYQRQHYSTVVDTFRDLIEGAPQVRTFEVATSTVHKITAEKAA